MSIVPDEYIEKLKEIPELDKEPLRYVMEDYGVEKDNLWLEFGVGAGTTINYFSQFTQKTVYGFDCFTGLPEKWRDGYEAGYCNQNKKTPTVNNNVQLITGLFEETLPFFIQNHPKDKVSFLHIDCDLYSSTTYVLNSLKNKITSGSIIVFDELINYPGFLTISGELNAWYEFIAQNDIQYEWIGMQGKLYDEKATAEKVALVIL